LPNRVGEALFDALLKAIPVFSRLDRRNAPVEIALWFCESDVPRVQ